jgi:hypothetical protein
MVSLTGKRRVLWNNPEAPAQPALIVEVKIPEPVKEALTIPSGSSKARSGNGHKSLKVRDLNNQEKALIRCFFAERNGCIGNDDCVRWRAERLEPEVAIFQVTGFVTYLHDEVRKGSEDLIRDINVYLIYIQGHRNLWATYNSPKYRALREKLARSQRSQNTLGRTLETRLA